MKIEVGVTKKEGFLDSLYLKFENGLVLKTESYVWKTRSQKDQVQADFIKVIEDLKAQGFEVTGTGVLDDRL